MGLLPCNLSSQYRISFPSGSLQRNQCEHLQKQVEHAILPKCGFNCNTRNVIIYGPSEYSGSEIRSHQTEQGITQIYSLMTSLRVEGVPRKLALITLTWAQLLAGTQQPVLSNVMNALPHIAPMKWIPLIQDFLHSIGGRMEVENLPATPVQREHDRFLMDTALDLYSKSSDLQHLNACRLHLQVTLLSDITTADSKFIRSEVIQSHQPLSNSANELFPYQSSPDAVGWNKLRTFLLHLTRTPAHSLIQPLGRWLHPSDALIRKWQSYIDLSTEIIYLRKQDTFEVYETLPPTPHYEYTRITV